MGLETLESEMISNTIFRMLVISERDTNVTPCAFDDLRNISRHVHTVQYVRAKPRRTNS